MSKTGFKLPGSLTVTIDTPTDMSETLKAKTVNFAEKVISRVAAADQSTFEADYYIMATYDINGKVAYTGSSAADGKDDGYSMTGFTITSANASSPVLYLPTGNNTIPAGIITAKDTVGSDADSTFNVNMSIKITSQGVLDDVTVSISGPGTLTKSIAENKNEAQVAYWDADGIPDDPTQSTADTLSATFNPSATYSDEIDAIKALYEGANADLIDSWSMSFSTVANSNENTLSQHARYKGLSGSDIFAAGEMIVAATPLSYSIKIKDVNNSDVALVTPTNVYGVVKQS